MLRFAAVMLALSVAGATNDYVQVSAHTKVCPEDNRIPLACGSCGPNWGELQDCENQCNAVAACTHITYFDDHGCRIYNGCDAAAASGGANVVDTQIYERHNAVPVPVPTPQPPAPTPPPPTPPPTPVPAGGAQPCDLFDAAGTPCVAAHSVTRALYGNYAGPLYQVRKGDGAGSPSCPACATQDIGLLSTGGVVDAAAQDKFCGDDECYISRIYDQSRRGNHLDTAPAGGNVHAPDKPVRAGALKVTVRGKPAYGAYFEGGMGYRVDKTDGVATGDDPETLYMVVSGKHYNGGCCFDYGNAETDNNDDGKGTMESIYFGNSTGWSRGTGNGPWVMADIENGLWAGSDAVNQNAPPLHHDFVTGMVKGDSGNHFALKAGDANTGTLTTTHDGVRPPGYQVMKKQGAIILGIGGDNSDRAIGTWFEGVMTSGYSSNATDDLVQANIAAAAYSFV